MHTIVFAQQKGGAAKTTTAINLAVCSVEAGYRTVIIDVDQQQSATKWAMRRGEKPPTVISCTPELISENIAALRSKGEDLVIVDTPGVNSSRLDAVFACADVVLLPVAPSILDLEASLPTARTLKALDRKFSYVIVKAPANKTRVTDAQHMLDRLAARAGVPISHRVDVPDATARGLGITEYRRNGDAAHEIQALWAWLANYLSLEVRIDNGKTQ